MQIDVDAARELVTATAGRGTERWLHSQGAADAARRVLPSLDAADQDLLIAAAWLHDIGFDHPRPPTGFHPLDGAQLVLDAGFPSRLAALVAHHSEARFTAAALGLLDLLNEFDRETGPVADALVYADMSSAADGQPVTVYLRLSELRQRNAESAPQLRAALASREPYLIMATARTEIRMINSGATSALILPVAADYQARDGHIDELQGRHPARDSLDVEAALHTSASLAFRSHALDTHEQLEHADALLEATDEPDFMEQPA
jgi:hypothetical protein